MIKHKMKDLQDIAMSRMFLDLGIIERLRGLWTFHEISPQIIVSIEVRLELIFPRHHVSFAIFRMSESTSTSIAKYEKSQLEFLFEILYYTQFLKNPLP